MAKKSQSVVPHQEGWAVKGAGNQWATSVYDTQQQVIGAVWVLFAIRSLNSSLTAQMTVFVTRIAMATTTFPQEVMHRD